jgi:hypothetical protein
VNLLARLERDSWGRRPAGAVIPVPGAGLRRVRPEKFNFYHNTR